MSAYSIPGDFTFLNSVTFSGGVSISDINALNLNLNTVLAPSTTNIGSNTSGVNVYLRADDLQIESIGNMRFDAAFGGSGNVNIANSNATHLQLGNAACAIDMTCTNFLHAGSGLFAVNGASISLQTLSSVVFSADNVQNVGISGASINVSSSGDVNVLSTGTRLQLGDSFHPTNIYSNGMDVYAQGGTITINASTQILIGGALTNAIAFGDASVVPQVLAFNSPRTFVNSPSFLFQTSVVDLSGQATSSPSTLKNVMMNNSGHLVVSTVINASQPFWTMGGNPTGLPIFGTTAAATGITMRTGVSSTFLNISGATGNMTFENQHATGTTAITSVGAMTISSVASLTVSAASWSLNTTGTLHLGGGGATDLSSGLSVSVSAPSVIINTSASTNETHIGNPLAGNVLFIDTSDVQIPNGTVITQGADSQWSGTGAFGINVTGILQLQSSAGNIFLGCPGTTTVTGASGVNIQITGAAVVTTLGNSFAGNTINLNSAAINAPNVPLVVGDISVPAHVPPAGSFYLIVDALGVVSKFSA